MVQTNDDRVYVKLQEIACACVCPFCPFLTSLNSSDCSVSMYPVLLLDKFCKHDIKLGQAVLDLIYGSVWEITSCVIEDSPMVFYIVPDQDGAFLHYLEVGPFIFNLISCLSWAHVCGMMRSLDELSNQ